MKSKKIKKILITRTYKKPTIVEDKICIGNVVLKNIRIMYISKYVRHIIKLRT